MSTTPRNGVDRCDCGCKYWDRGPYYASWNCHDCHGLFDPTDVHTEHCCSDHGCAYSDPDCTVTDGSKPQSHPCLYCDMTAEEVSTWLPHATDDELRAEVARRHLRFADEVNMTLLQATLPVAREAAALRQEVGRLQKLLDATSQTR